MQNSEFKQAQLAVETAQNALKNYLLNSYYKTGEDSTKCAKRSFNYLEQIVDSIIKKNAYRINFDKGGSPLWHAKVLALLSQWIEAEYKISYLLSKELDQLE